jgi:hypothetical protein
MTITKRGDKYWTNLKGQFHRKDGPAIEDPDGTKSCCVNGELLGFNDEGFWALWDMLTPEQKQDPVLLSYLPGGFKCLSL